MWVTPALPCTTCFTSDITIPQTGNILRLRGVWGEDLGPWSTAKIIPEPTVAVCLILGALWLAILATLRRGHQNPHPGAPTTENLPAARANRRTCQ